MLETIHEYAREQLAASGEAAALAIGYRSHLTALAEEAGVGLKGHEQLGWLARLDADRDNVRPALAWAQERVPAAPQAAALGLHLMAGLYLFWFSRSAFVEAGAIAEALLAVGAGAPPEARAAAHNVAANAAAWTGNYRAARRHYEAGLELCTQAGDCVGRAWMQGGVASARRQAGDVPDAFALNKAAVSDLLGSGRRAV